MIKIIEKEVKIVKEYDVEPKVVTLYYVDRNRKDVKKVENYVFKNASPVVWGATDANEYRLVYENGTLVRDVIIDIKTGIVKEKSYHFFDYEQAIRVHRKLRSEFLRDRIVGLKGEVTRLKEYQKELEELEK